MTDSLDRIQPQAKDIERAIIGGCMLSNDALGYACEHISEEMFFSPSHQVIFTVLHYFYTHDVKFDQLVLVEELIKRGQLENIGGEAAIAGLMRDAVSAANIDKHCEIVASKYKLRKLILMCNTIVNDAYNEKCDAQALINKANTLLDGVVGEDKERGFTTLKEMLYPAFDAIEKANDNEGVLGIPTGFPTLDDLTNGWQNGNTIIIGANKKAGKSFMAGVFASQAIVSGYPVGMFTLEMTAIALTKRFISYHARVDTSAANYKKLDADDFKDMTNACQRLSGYAVLVFDDSAGITIDEMIVKAKRMKKIYDIKLLVVDYIQLMPSSGDESRQREVEKISHGLKAIAKTMNIPVLIVSQLSRPAKGKENLAPLMTDLRDSSSLEADASIVLLIYEPKLDRKKELVTHVVGKGNCWMDDDPRFKRIRELVIAANREGNTGNIPMIFYGEYAHFGELSDRDDEFAINNGI